MAKPQADKKSEAATSFNAALSYVPQPAYGFARNPYGAMGAGYGVANGGYQQLVIYGRGPMPVGMQMVPMVYDARKLLTTTVSRPRNVLVWVLGEVQTAKSPYEISGSWRIPSPSPSPLPYGDAYPSRCYLAHGSAGWSDRVNIHTDTLNEFGFVEHTIDTFKGRTIHTYHRKEKGTMPSAADLFLRSHSKMEGSQRVLATNKARRTMVEYERLMSHYQSQGIEKHPDMVFYEAVGGHKKGQVYGLGESAPMYFEPNTFRSSRASSYDVHSMMSIDRQTFEEMQRSITHLTQRIEHLESQTRGGCHDFTPFCLDPRDPHNGATSSLASFTAAVWSSCYAYGLV